MRHPSVYALALLASAVTSPALAQPTCDLVTEAHVPALGDPDTDVTFTILVTNAGPDPADSVTLSDPLPAGLTFVSLASPGGWSCTTPTVGTNGTVSCTVATLAASDSGAFTLVAHIDPGAAAGTFFTNIVSSTTTTPDVTSENDSMTATVQTPPPPAGDLFVEIAGPQGTNPDTDVTYVESVTNAGSGEATNVTFTQTIPGTMTFVSFVQNGGPTFACTQGAGSVTCTIASMLPSESATFTFVGHVPPGTPDGTRFQAFVSVASDYDPNVENDMVPTLVCVQADSCAAGPCNANAAVVCPAPDQCHQQSTCNTLTGVCDPIPVTDGTACDDASVCTASDTCQAGICTGANPMSCDDGNACTVDVCDAVSGCMSSGGCDAGMDAGQDVDAGSDANVPPADAGSTTPRASEGCGCSLAGSESRDGGAIAWLCALAALVVVRRRRARSLRARTTS